MCVSQAEALGPDAAGPGPAVERRTAALRLRCHRLVGADQGDQGRRTVQRAADGRAGCPPTRTGAGSARPPRPTPRKHQADTVDGREPRHDHRRPARRAGGPAGSRKGWPLWEVFIRARRGLSHQHVGSLHAPDAAMALRNARDVYTRRGEGVSIWVVPSARSPRPVPTRRTRSSIRRWTRPTGTRPSTTCRRGCPTCDRRRPEQPALTSPTQRDRHRPGCPRHLRSRAGRRRAHPRPATGRMDHPGPADRGGHRAGQHRARPARPGPHAAQLRRRGGGRSPAPGTRTIWPSCATSGSSATCTWWRSRTVTSPSPWPGS